MYCSWSLKHSGDTSLLFTNLNFLLTTMSKYLCIFWETRYEIRRFSEVLCSFFSLAVYKYLWSRREEFTFRANLFFSLWLSFPAWGAEKFIFVVFPSPRPFPLRPLKYFHFNSLCIQSLSESFYISYPISSFVRKIWFLYNLSTYCVTKLIASYLKFS